MQYRLIKEINKNYTPLQQILTNRGINFEDIEHYTHTTDEDILSYEGLGEEKLKAAAARIIKAIEERESTIIIIDSDCDGFSSAALLTNYLFRLAPYWSKSYLSFFLHKGKQHGLNDCYEIVKDSQCTLVLCPDSASNDIEEAKVLKENGKDVICLDHHIVEKESDYSIVINNQNSEYRNKDAAGVHVTWQFCRYLDKTLNKNYADDFLDLVALGDTSDMMSLLSIETKHLINKGFRPENVKNPFIYNMWQKNKFKLGDNITSWGAAFYIAPFVNAICRSGTQEEKTLVFLSMLEEYAYKEVPSTKRGHKEGEYETIVEQALRTCTNVKNRQSKKVDSSMENLEELIDNNNMLSNKALVFTIEENEVDRNVAGLIASKISAKYQKPCCILLKGINENGQICYSGSARGCDTVGITNFKDICENTDLTLFAQGHNSAFGVSVLKDDIESFVEKLNTSLEWARDESIYDVDYILNNKDIDSRIILDIAEMDCYWGKDCQEALLAIENLIVTPDMVTVYDKSSITIKIELDNGVTLMLFRASEADRNKLKDNNTGYVKINCIGTANKNEWNGNVTPQIFMTEYEVVDSNKYLF
jgi:single-stranded-DNA-specific exonuclease